jgi:hypothetical protein
MMLDDVSRLYGVNKDRVVLRFDSARSHTAKVTYDWLDAHVVKYITKDEWPANSPDLSPMDYSINGIFKRHLRKRKAFSLRGLIRVRKDEWSTSL